jgi:hypothetical protein
MARARISSSMRQGNPKGFWDGLRAFIGWSEDKERREQAQDPALLFHLLFTVPLGITTVASVRRLLGR